VQQGRHKFNPNFHLTLADTMRARPVQGGFMSIQSQAVSAVTASTSENSGTNMDFPTPDYLLPAMGKFGSHEPVYYRSLFFLNTLCPSTGDLETLNGPIDPFDDNSLPKEAELKPAFGLLTVHKQVWRQKGLALGNLLQSVCLAPGEVTQLAVTRWEHTTTATSTETTEQGESVSNQSEQHRAVNEVQRAVATEAQWGTSSAYSSSASAQAGASFLFGSAAVSSTTSTALTAQFSGGNRNLAAESSNAIDQRTAESSHALRSRRQTVVREVSEREAETLSTRVLANYNRRHTLNVLFFEVLQTYEVKTVLSGWDRCLFVPMVPLDFEKTGVIVDHQAELLSIFREFGATGMIEHLDRALGEEESAMKTLAGYELERNALEAARQLAQQFADLQREYKRAQEDVDSLAEFIARSQQAIEAIDTGRVKDTHNNRRGLARGLEDQGKFAPRLKAVVDQKAASLKELQAQWATLAGQRKELPPIDDAARQIQTAIDDFTAKIAGYKIPVGKIFNKNRVFLSQQLWLRMSPYRIHRILQKFQIADVAEPLSSLVDPQPVGVFGNYLAFRWGFSQSAAGREAHDGFAATHLDKSQSGTDQATGGETIDEQTGEIIREVRLPTSGIFAEAVLGQGLAAEAKDKHFATFGDDDSKIPILPPKIADLQSRDRVHGMDLKAQDFGTSLAQLRAEKLGDISHIDQILGQLGKGDMFRDMGGLAQATALAEKIASMSAEGATKAGDRAVLLQSKVLDAFGKVLDSDAVKSALADSILPGSGAAVTAATKAPGSSGKK
jgi:hypothetical protein